MIQYKLLIPFIVYKLLLASVSLGTFLTTEVKNLFCVILKSNEIWLFSVNNYLKHSIQVLTPRLQETFD